MSEIGLKCQELKTYINYNIRIVRFWKILSYFEKRNFQENITMNKKVLKITGHQQEVYRPRHNMFSCHPVLMSMVPSTSPNGKYPRVPPVSQMAVTPEVKYKISAGTWTFKFC